MPATNKYLPLKQISFIAVAIFLASTLIALPVALLLKSVPFGGWLIAFKSYIPVSSIMLLTAILIGWLYCELVHLNLNTTITTILFGFVAPVVFFILLGVLSQISHSNFFEGITTKKGIENFMLIYGLLGFFMGSLSYYATKKKA
ncbi:hypothetical protein [Cellvibrio sp. UBA7671]|uniref:hypothetical protein n=1 Tax=Cellvibrio sp. UBA7671 TaxID=1946312 RepID=UPI002F34F4B8